MIIYISRQLYHGESEKLLFDYDINSVNFSHDGKVLAIGSKYNVKLWERDSERTGIPTTVKFEKGDVKAVAYSPDGQMMAMASDIREVKLHSIASPDSSDIILKLPDNLREAAVTFRSNIAFSPDGKRVAVGISATPKIQKRDSQCVDLGHSDT